MVVCAEVLMPGRLTLSPSLAWLVSACVEACWQWQKGRDSQHDLIRWATEWVLLYSSSIFSHLFLTDKVIRTSPLHKNFSD
jgi:hypothetical protein